MPEQSNDNLAVGSACTVANTEITNDCYQSYHHAATCLAGISPSDYFFAKEISRAISPDVKRKSLDDAGLNRLSSQAQQWFHLLIALSESLRNGHSCLPIIEIAGQGYAMIKQANSVKHQGFVFAEQQALHDMLTDMALTADDSQPIVYQNQRLYMRRYFQFEQELKLSIFARQAQALATKSATDNKGASEQAIKAVLDQLFSNTSATAEVDWQKVAVANAINKDFSIIAGGPGTGKTYTVTKLLAALLILSEKAANQPIISLVAPTGKAAQRLSESIINAVQGFRGTINDQVLDLIPNQAQTIHRLLGVMPNQVNFRHQQDNVLPIDILLIDEVSMVDLPMMTRIFRALAPQTKVILLGDADQLPSVAVGGVLADLAPRPHRGYSAENHRYLSAVTGFNSLELKAKNTLQACVADNVTFLHKSRRFDGEGGIARLANFVIKGQKSSSWQLLEQSLVHKTAVSEPMQVGDNTKQLSLLTGATELWLTPLVEQYYAKLFDCDDIADAFALLGQFRVLSATRNGPQGVDSINALVTKILQDKQLIPYNQALYPARPIMISENDYRLGVYNGDIGLLWPNDNGHLMAVFETATGEYQWLMPSRLPKFATVYAMTIHKTQGSEFDHVAMVLPEQKDNRLLSRELLYTGITRAKSQLSIACNERVWRSGVQRQIQRFSGLMLD